MKTQHNTATGWRRWLLPAFPALAALALILAAARPASAAFVFHSQNYIQVIQAANNPCTSTGGTVLITGVDHQVLELTLDGNSLDSVFHFINHQNVQLTGIDNEGNAYSGNLIQNTAFSGRVGQESTAPLSLPLVSQGSSPNFNVHAILHFTVHADGTVTAFVNDVTAVCVG